MSAAKAVAPVASAKASPAVASARQAVQGPGEALAPGVRGFMESRFGHDFGRVRVHHDPSSARSARGLGALAYAVGEHLVFDAGEFAPSSPRGRQVLAHELAHVVQQRPLAAGWEDEPMALGPAQDRFEREAHEASRAVMQGHPRVGALSVRGAARAAIQCLRPDELVDPSNPAKGDRFQAQTFKATPSQIRYKLDGKDVSVPKELGVFVPSNAASNKVHLFFTPYFAADKGQPVPMAALSYAAEQGLRAQAETSGWILIVVPALEEGDKPYVTVSTGDIQSCLATVGRQEPNKIEAIRLTAHSRGYRGLARTMGWTSGGAPEIDLSKVDRVSVFDASYQDLGKTLRSHIKDLPGLQSKSDPTQFDQDAVRLYDVTVANVSGLPGIDLRDPLAVQGLAYVRFTKDAIQRGLLDPAEFGPPSASDKSPRPPADVRAATTRLLAKLPVRGDFVTPHPQAFLKWAPGITNLQDFLKTHRDDLRLVARAKDGLKGFLIEEGLNAGGQPWGNDAHHWLATELAHEATE